jgi:hypothetical protein
MIAAILNTGIFMGIIGMSMLFRMQLAWPEQSFKIFNILLGDKFAPEWSYGQRYLPRISHHTRYHNGILCTNGRPVVLLVIY